MSVSRPWYRSFWRVLLLTLTALYSFWYMATPRVGVYYSDKGTGQLSFVWDTQHSIYRGEISPGGVTGDAGHIFPNENFFMEFYWWRDNERRHCISITPKWPAMNIYINADGEIDRSNEGGTDIDRLKECQWDSAKP